MTTSPAPVSAATVIDTFSFWNGEDDVIDWGGDDSTPTYGQTFTAPADTFLTSASFAILNPAASGIDYQAFVYAWDGSAITGSALFTGPVATVAPAATFQAIIIDTEWTELVTGQQYVVFLTTTTTASLIGDAFWGQPGSSNPYAGGAFVFSNSATLAGLTDDWTLDWLGSGGDLAFRLEFSSTPEPATSALLLSGAAAILAMRRRRRPDSSQSA